MPNMDNIQCGRLKIEKLTLNSAFAFITTSISPPPPPLPIPLHPSPPSLPERGSLGLRFFSQSRANSQRRQMKSCLSAVVMKTQSQIGRQSRTSDDGDRGGGGGPQVEREREYLLNTLR